MPLLTCRVESWPCPQHMPAVAVRCAAQAACRLQLPVLFAFPVALSSVVMQNGQRTLPASEHHQSPKAMPLPSACAFEQARGHVPLPPPSRELRPKRPCGPLTGSQPTVRARGAAGAVPLTGVLCLPTLHACGWGKGFGVVFRAAMWWRRWRRRPPRRSHRPRLTASAGASAAPGLGAPTTEFAFAQLVPNG